MEIPLSFRWKTFSLHVNIKSSIPKHMMHRDVTQNISTCPLFVPEKDRDKSDSDVSWHPQNITCARLYRHICVYNSACVRVSVCIYIWMCVYVVYLFGGESLRSGGSRLTSLHPANSHWSLPPLSLSLSLFLPSISLLSKLHTPNMTKTSTVQELEKEDDVKAFFFFYTFVFGFFIYYHKWRNGPQKKDCTTKGIFQQQICIKCILFSALELQQ